MTATDEFLTRLPRSNFNSVFQGLDETWNGRAKQLNDMLAGRDLPVRAANLSSIWMVHYTKPSRYNWMLQFYLARRRARAELGRHRRLIFSLNYIATDFAAVAQRFISAVAKLKQDGFWWQDAPLNNKAIRRQIQKEVVNSAFSWRVGRP